MPRITRTKKITTKRDKPGVRSATSVSALGGSAEASPAAPPYPLARECERLEQLCQALEARAEAAEEAHRRTASSVAHDLCNAINVIMMSSKLLLRGLAPDAPGRKQIDAILRITDELEQLARDLVDASHLEAGSLRVSQEPLEVAPLVERALQIAAPVASAKPVTLVSEVSERLRPLLGERDRLVQVLVALITNAVRFTPRGGQITLRAEPAGSGHGGAVRFSIADTGPGIQEDQRDGLFARFGPSRRPQCQTVGLGPFVAKGIVEAHGGEIWVESAPGAGTTVRFTIPAPEDLPAAITAAAM